MKEGEMGRGEVGSGERLYQNAVVIVRETGFATVSLIQRRFALGYVQASKVIDRMEREGVVGPFVKGTVKREVLPFEEPTETPPADAGGSRGDAEAGSLRHGEGAR